ncbi:MAG: hypothetical protein EOO73_05265 [Myxococcales bacterium]|nr:MAG: hypothetical protein EOO73_05265 [Myxococcales bacterium]
MRPAASIREHAGLTDSSVPKQFRAGTDRAEHPQTTLEKVSPFFKTAGITRVANITGLDRIGIPVVAVMRPNSRSVAVSQGKGATLTAAKVSGVMEAIEAYHAEHIKAPLVLASARELGAEAIPVEGLPRTTSSVYSPELRLLWMSAQLPLRGKRALVPYELVHLDFRAPFPTGTGAFVMSSNGLASGNHLTEATSHAIGELIERDANTLWRLLPEDERRATRVDLASVDHELCSQLLHRFEAAEVEVAVWETTTELGVPSFRCGIADRAPEVESPTAPAYGSGCHARRAVALSRALTEAAQGRLTMISGSRDDLGAQDYAPAEVRARLQRFRAATAAPPTRAFERAPNHESATLDADLSWMLSRLQECGFEDLAVVDLSRAEAGIAVVRVIVPGLEPISEMPGYFPGLRARARLEQR